MSLESDRKNKRTLNASGNALELSSNMKNYASKGDFVTLTQIRDLELSKMNKRSIVKIETKKNNEEEKLTHSSSVITGNKVMKSNNIIPSKNKSLNNGVSHEDKIFYPNVNGSKCKLFLISLTNSKKFIIFYIFLIVISLFTLIYSLVDIFYSLTKIPLIVTEVILCILIFGDIILGLYTKVKFI